MSNTGSTGGLTPCARCAQPTQTSTAYTGCLPLPEGFCLSAAPWEGFYETEDALVTSP